MAQVEFMTEKEKNYVAECIKKNLKYLKTEINYSFLFSKPESQKIPITLNNETPKKTQTCFFGRDTRKSRRSLKESASIPDGNLSLIMKTRVVLEDIEFLFSMRRYCDAGSEENEKNSAMLISALSENFGRLVSIPKFFKFLEKYVVESTEAERLSIIIMLQKSFHLIEDIQEFYDFISKSINLIPKMSKEQFESGFTNSFLSFPCGLILSTALLIQNNTLSDIFYLTVNDEPTTRYISGKYVWQFLAVLISLLNEEQQQNIVIKVQPRLVEIVKNKDEEELEHAKVFLKSIGVTADDIIV